MRASHLQRVSIEEQGARMPGVKPWHEQDALWETIGPMLFSNLSDADQMLLRRLSSFIVSVSKLQRVRITGAGKICVTSS